MQKYKSFVIVLLFIGILPVIGFGQLKIGIKGGFSTYDLGKNDLNIFNQPTRDSLVLKIKDANFGIHGGLVIRYLANHFYVQLEGLFNSNSVNYKLNDFQGIGVVDTILKESFLYLDIPLMFGLKAGPLRLNAGPVGHIYMKHNSELGFINGLKEDFKTITYGYQAGIGLDIWKLTIDARYEGNFTNFGDQINIGGSKFTFANSPARFIVSLGLLF